jgi:hypothetical protein
MGEYINKTNTMRTPGELGTGHCVVHRLISPNRKENEEGRRADKCERWQKKGPGMQKYTHRTKR